MAGSPAPRELRRTRSGSAPAVPACTSRAAVVCTAPAAVLACALVTAAFLLAMAAAPAVAQVYPETDQSIAPAYEGWEQNEDGSFNLVFGYMNRNWDQELDVPIGPDNRLDPGGPDRGQPTHFQPRRNRHVFRVRVPADFGDGEVVWTLVSNGQTERAYATLHPDYFLNDIAIMNNNGAGGPAGGAYNIFGNERPVLDVEGDSHLQARVGESIVLTAVASDDGVPKRRAMPPPSWRLGRGGAGTPNSASGLRVAWIVYRGEDHVTFDPPQFEVWEDYREGADSPWAPGWEPPEVPEDGAWVVEAAFGEPGTYVLRCLAHDGGLATHEDVTVTVSP